MDSKKSEENERETRRGGESEFNGDSGGTSNERKKHKKKKHSKKRSKPHRYEKGTMESKPVDIKREIIDDAASVVSDLNPPSFTTRLKEKKKKRREEGSISSTSTSRKARSEPPILITLDSESDDEKARPNRKSRIKEASIRQMGRMTIARKHSYRSEKHSSSSDYEADMKKKHRKKKLRSMAAAKAKKNFPRRYLTSSLAVTRLKRLQERRIRAEVKPRKNAKKSKKSRKNSTGDTPRKRGRPRKEDMQKKEKVSDVSNDESENNDDRNDATFTPKIINKKKKRDVSGSDDEDYKQERNSISESSNEEANSEDAKKNKSRLVRSVVEKKKKLKDTLKKDELSDYDPLNAIRDISDFNPQEPFLQSSFCFDVATRVSKCRECRLAMTRNSRKMYNSYCRFMEYRKLCHSKNGVISSAGFSRPNDATDEHLNLWLPQPSDPPKDLNLETAESLLRHIGDQFCDLVAQESEALSLHMGCDNDKTWKRIVHGVREMCDVCSTTIFNMHWVCPSCGFAVCIDCYKGRKQGIIPEEDEDSPRDRDEYKWLLCTMRQGSRHVHKQDSLVLTQMIPGNALWDMQKHLHRAKLKLNIPSYCKCEDVKKIELPEKALSSGINKQLMSCVAKIFSHERGKDHSEQNRSKSDNGYGEFDVSLSKKECRWLKDNGSKGEDITLPNNCFRKTYEDFHLLRSNLLDGLPERPEDSDNMPKTFSTEDVRADISKSGKEIKSFTHRYPQPKSGKDPQPIRIYTSLESKLAFTNVPHSWYCNGRLLFLHDPLHKDNMTLFQEQWKRGQPIVVKDVHKQLDIDLWHPTAFCRDFGEVKNDLVDCRTGIILRNLPMRRFWEGFEDLGKRMRDENEDYLLLKLKDWPPGEDFREKLPDRFDDLMKGLPLQEYTHRDGILNLAGRLPSYFVRPDLGPKMYNAYGSAFFPSKGTTNLHLDISDAVNVMVYVGIPKEDGFPESITRNTHIEEAMKALVEGGCDSLMHRRVNVPNTNPGALWHIFNAKDADKIRDMLNKVAVEKGEKLEANTDPIHDQSWYIDSKLRMRLYKEYGVEGYAIAQCLGDAVFIPAGAPHQVRNLHSCVKVAEDFVSPENIAHCFKLTQEFRNLSDTHTNHEDKLQIKNIIYHVVKDSLSHILTVDEIR